MSPGDENRKPVRPSHHSSNNHDETARRVTTGKMAYINLHRAMLFPRLALLSTFTSRPFVSEVFSVFFLLPQRISRTFRFTNFNDTWRRRLHPPLEQNYTLFVILFERSKWVTLHLENSVAAFLLGLVCSAIPS